MAEQEFYFVDTRENAKSKEPFAISNGDVAKTWKRDYNNGEGPFKPVDVPESELQINRRDLQEAGLNETPNQIEATKHNLEVVKDEKAPSAYDGMNKDELVQELEARGLEFKKSGPESTKDFYIEQLVKDDNE